MRPWLRPASVVATALSFVACSGGDEDGGPKVPGDGGGTGSKPGSGGTTQSGGSGGLIATGGQAGSTSGGAAGSAGSGGAGGTLPAGPTRYPATAVTSPITEYVATRLRAIADQNTTRKGDVFMKVGDSHTVSKNLMYCFAGPAQASYQLNLAGHDALLPSIQHFRGGMAAGTTPFDRASLAAVIGKSASWATNGSPSPIAQELGALNARFALVSYGTNDMQMGVSFSSALWPFHENMSKLLEQLEGDGVIPIVAGLLPRGDGALAAIWANVYDIVTRGLAEGRQLPYLSVYLATKDLPKQGLAGDGLHGNAYVAGTTQPCVFTSAGLAYNYNVRNLHSMEQLDVVKRVVLDSAAAPDPTLPATQGDGSPTTPFVIDALPFTHHASTTDSPNSAIGVYSGCGSSADESGPELYYTLVVTQPTPIRAMLFDRSGVDVDLHLLSGGMTGAACKARHDRLIERTLQPGTHTFVVDSFVSAGKPLSGQFMLAIMRCDPSDTACQ